MLRYAPRFHGKNPKNFPKKFQKKKSKKKILKKNFKKNSQNQKTFMPKLLRM
jgi:hypothetical protein